ncbi:TadE family type IV pilus minor pilin [Nocardiopsis sp. RSe5-2]|uniref:TadE family type IV pilus minor pilin n=1 Tax=Nocardiopsis endophytica TaxID=3018445 RepID=A0ABT4TYT2_9ACTN|nr:TadE family type IV pilus minor pilin [Nocardiopsis endophytica]MDA2809292.1 TadE family type IV pilus minor pilin [Nocardiopsis endophytica]
MRSSPWGEARRNPRPEGNPGGGERSAPDAERGIATAETAVALPALALVLALSIAAVNAVATHLECVDAARAGARALARGESEAVVLREASRAAPEEARVRASRTGGEARVEVSAPVRIMPGMPAPVRAVATAATPVEPGAAP